MSQSRLVNIKFKTRTASNASDKGIAEQYDQGGPFDVDLITSDNKCVSAHRFVLAMFSKVWSNKFVKAGIDGVIVVPIDLPHHLVKKLVELLYFRETSVLPNEKDTLMNALKSLKISGVFDDDGFKAPANVPPSRQNAAINIAPSQVVGRSNVRQSVNPAAMNTQAGAYPPAKRTQQQAQSVCQPTRPHTMQAAPIVQQVMTPAALNVPSGTNLPAKRTLQRAQSVYQRPTTSTQNLTNLDILKKYPNLSLSKVPATPTNGGPTQSVINRQPASGQLVVPIQMLPPAHLVKKPLPAAAQKQQQKSVVQAVQVKSKIPVGLTVSAVPKQRNNQSMQQQQQQQQQQSIDRIEQIHSPPKTVQPSLSPVENTGKNVASVTAKPIQNGQNDEVDDIANLPIAMEIDETIGNGASNDTEVSIQEAKNDGGGAGANVSKVTNDMDAAAFIAGIIDETVTQSNTSNTSEDQNDFDDHFSNDEDDDFDGFDEHDYQDDGNDHNGNDNGNDKNNNNNKITDFQDNQTQ